MIDIHIRDENFFNEANPEMPNQYFNLVWDRSPVASDITIFTDSFIREVETSKSLVKIAWLIEPPVINSDLYGYVFNNYDKFDMVLTFDEDLVKLSDKIRYCPYGTTWILGDDKKIYEKTKRVSAIFSDKRFTYGHSIRHDIFSEFKDQVDFFGAINNNKIDLKVDGHKDYAFSIIVENWAGNSYFSEKLLDCLLTGTIPVYWGFHKFREVFDPNGFIYFTEVSQLKDIIPHLNEEQYYSRIEAVKSNYNTALKYTDLCKSLWYSGLKDYDTKVEDLTPPNRAHEQWVRDNGDATLRLDYPLTSDSVVLDVGGFCGTWSESIFNRYGCTIHIFEPVKSFYSAIKEKFKGNDKVTVHNYGLSDCDCYMNIHIDPNSKDASSLYTESATVESVELRSASKVITDLGVDIDLMKINVEGSEYEILPDIIGAGLQTKIKNLQIQFHDISKTSVADRVDIRLALAGTHKETYSYRFIWENWELDKVI